MVIPVSNASACLIEYHFEGISEVELTIVQKWIPREILF